MTAGWSLPCFVSVLVIFLSIPVSQAVAGPDFKTEIAPLLSSRCVGCHNAQDRKGGLDLSTASGFRQGADDHEIFKAGDPDASLLIEVVSGAKPRMPFRGDRLTADEVARLKEWIRAGADWPEAVTLTASNASAEETWWSLRPLTRPAVPGADKTGAGKPVANPIDAFVEAELQVQGLKAVGPADRRTLIRRLWFDVVGLPPSPEVVAAYVGHTGDEETAWSEAVDRLLASPHYGERQARHWLDVVHYGDTHGFDKDKVRTNAWPYRDYVIRSFNADKPYSQFVLEQVAGDVVATEKAEGIPALGFLAAGPWDFVGQVELREGTLDKQITRNLDRDDFVATTCNTFLALTVQCARCHDHKFDPISQADYYSMQAFVAGVEYLDGELVPEAAAAWDQAAMTARPRIDAIDTELSRFATPVGAGVKRPAVNAKLNIDRFRPVRTRRVRFTVLKTNSLEPCIDELEIYNRTGRNQALASLGTVTRSSGDNVSPNEHELRFINDGDYGNASSWMSNETGGGWVEVEFPQETEVAGVRWGRDREGEYDDRLAIEYRIEAKGGDDEWFQLADHSDREEWTAKAKPAAATVQNAGLTDDEIRQRDALIAERTHWQEQVTAAENTPKVFAGEFREPDVIHILSRGDPEQPRDLVVPAVLSALGNQRLKATTPEAERRQALADWIASPDHPLTARVMANRVWQGHFGMGLVETASDFGRSGTPPSHPELLDWLARKLIAGKWSLKSLHREIALSATYRQSTAWNDAAAAVDRDARWLWHYPLRRLEAEAMRDSMLDVAGRLNFAMYGRGFDLFDRRGGLTGFTPIESYQGAGLRRMVYAHKVRREREAVFGSFDCPDAGQSTARRRESTTPIQALNLFNSRFTLEAATALAERVDRESGPNATTATRVSRMYDLVLNRPPTAEELADAEEIAPRHGLVPLARALFNSNEFLFIP